MNIKEFNSLEEIKKYYDKKRNTYIFEENGNYIGLIIFRFDLNVKANIRALNIIGRDIKVLDIKALDIRAGDIDALNIVAGNINAVYDSFCRWEHRSKPRCEIDHILSGRCYAACRR